MFTSKIITSFQATDKSNNSLNKIWIQISNIKMAKHIYKPNFCTRQRKKFSTWNKSILPTFFQIYRLCPYNTAERTPRTAPEYSANKVLLKNYFKKTISETLKSEPKQWYEELTYWTNNKNRKWYSMKMTCHSQMLLVLFFTFCF